MDLNTEKRFDTNKQSRGISRIMETESVYMANKLIKSNWIIIAAYISNYQKGIIKFSLGEIS